MAELQQTSKVWNAVERNVGPLTQKSKHWRVAPNGDLSVFVTFSKYHSKPDHYSFGIRPQDLNRWLDYARAFVVFVMGTGEDALILPANELRRQIELSNFKSQGSPLQYKLHLKKVGRKVEFTEFPEFDTSGYWQNYLQMQSAYAEENHGAIRHRIAVNPRIHFGKPCVVGTRIPVQSVLELVREGLSFTDIIRDYYSDLTPEDVRACIQYAMDVVAVEDINLATTP